MATKKFGHEPKMKTTEPSNDEVGHGMKKGGHAGKKHMMMGGEPMGMPMGSPLMARARMAMAGSAKKPPMMRKEGGKADMEQDKAMIKKAFKQHDMQEHKGDKGTSLKLKKGGEMTGGIEGPGYKKGGHTKKRMADGGTLHPAIDVQDKVVEAKQRKSISSKTGALEGAGYKHGGHSKKHYAKGGTVSQNVANRYENTMIHDGEHSPMQKKAGTGEIKQVPAGYKKGGHVKHHAHGGHVAHHTTHGHEDHGHKHMHQMMPKNDHEHHHESIDGHPMKHGGKAHHSTKMSTHHKMGGKCNY
jgi:hypothetical protein